jgi:hypothetical protein
MEQPATLDDASVELFMAAFLAAVEDKVREALLDDDAAAQAVMANALRSVVAAALPSGALNYALTVSVPLSIFAAPAAARRLSGARRRLQASAQDSLAALLTDGTLTQKLLEAGVDNAAELISSGALGVAAAAVEPSPSPSPSPSATPRWGASAAVLLGGLPASAFDAAGMLTQSTVGSIEGALAAGIAAACAACTVRVSSVENSATGAVVFAGARRLAAASYKASFFVGGAGAAAAAAGINTAAAATQLSTLLGATITVTLPAMGAAAPSGLSPGGAAGVAAGVAVAAVLLATAAVAWRNMGKNDAKAPGKVKVAAGGMVINVPTGATVVIPQAAPPS